MRRLIIFLILLAVAAGVGFAVFTAYNNHREPLKLDDMSSKDRVIYPDGSFEGKFRCETENIWISGFEYEVEDGRLYITVYASGGNIDFPETDKDGYVTIRIEGLTDITEVYYLYDDNKRELVFEYAEFEEDEL